MTINVLQIAHSYNPPYLGIAQAYAKAFQDERYHVTTVFLKGKTFSNPEKLCFSDRVIFFELEQGDTSGIKLDLIQTIAGIIRRHEIDIVIAQRYKAIYLAGMVRLLKRKRKFKLLGVVHAHGVFDKFTRRLLIRLLGKKICLLGVSGAISEELKQRLPKQLIYKQPHCVDFKSMQKQQLSKKEARSELLLDENKYIIGWVGRLHSEKDPETMIRAFAKAKLENSELVIIGIGALQDSLQKLIVTLGLEDKVKLLGFVADAYLYFKAFDCFVLSSRTESFGVVLLEAMSAGVPCLSSNSAGGREILEEEQLFPIGNAAVCARLLEYYKRLPEQEKQELIAENFTKLEERFSQAAFNARFFSNCFLELA